MSKTKRHAIIVLGMHRSGTSALAGTLGLLRAQLPARLMPTTPDNPKGYFEPDHIVAIHDRVLAVTDIAWSSIKTIPENWFRSAEAAAFADEIAEAVRHDYGEAALFVVKDPRMCRLIPLWRDVLVRVGAQASFALPFRHPVEVAHSLEKRNGLSLAHGCLLWLRHVLEAEHETRGAPRVFLRYRDLLDAPGAMAKRVAACIADGWPQQGSDALPEIEAFIDPTLRHNVANEEELQSSVAFFPWLRGAYESYVALARCPTDETAERQLDHLRATFDTAVASLMPFLEQEATKRTSIAVTPEERVAHQKAERTTETLRDQQEGQITALEQALLNRNIEIARIKRTLAEYNVQLGAALARHDSEIASIQDALAERNVKLAALNRVLASRNNEIATLKNTLIERETKIVTLDDALVARNAEITALGSGIVERDANVATLQTTISDLLTSTSWRVTAPLRWAKKLLGRARYSAVAYPLTLVWRVMRTRSFAPLREWRGEGIIARSGFFDKEWYLKNNPDVAAWKIDPIRHYVAFGAREGRSPSSSFSTTSYLSQNPDVSAAGANPLTHYILHGASEGRMSGHGGGPCAPLQRKSVLEWIGNQAVNLASSLGLLREATRLAGGITPLAMKSWRVLRDEGFGGLINKVHFFKQNRASISDNSVHAHSLVARSFKSFGIVPAAIPDALANAQRWCTGDSPEVSIVIINWNAARLTLECVRQIWANTEDVTYEIIIADNGSDPQSIVPLKKLGSGTRLLEFSVNRFFGEANNIAAEHAKGKYLCFLNNDAFVRPGWLRSLTQELDKTPEAGAVGPMFLFPDNTLQEAGGAIDENGYPTRFGRHLDPATPEFNESKFVDYVSAAAMLMEKQLFIAAGGFELAYEPAYYEDADLCFKLHAIGRKTRYCPTAKVIHIEGSSANDNVAAQERRKALGDLNRGKFVERWGPYLKTRSEQSLLQLRQKSLYEREQKEKCSASRAETVRSVAGDVAVYTPYALTPGGGERYILTAAAALASDRRVTIVTPHPYSHIRLRSLGLEFGVDLSQCDLVTYEHFVSSPRPEFMFTLGNHIVPSVPPHAENSWYICQFPFPADAAELERCRSFLAGYQGICVYSGYTKDHTLHALKKHRLHSVPVEIIHPPAPMIGGDAGRKKNIILAVGRFFKGGHNKRQDLMIAAFGDIMKNIPEEVELHLAGSSLPDPSQMAYLGELQKMAQQLPVKFHINPTQDVLSGLYRDAAIYWHATGLQCDLKREPEKAEHFGISIVEAMSAECVPLAFNAGGPREIIKNGVDGFLYDTTGSLVELTLDLLRGSGAARRVEMGRAARISAARFSAEHFVSNIRRLVDTVGAN